MFPHMICQAGARGRAAFHPTEPEHRVENHYDIRGYVWEERAKGKDSPLWLPARRKAEMQRIMPKMSCDKSVFVLPWRGSSWRSERRDPEAVMICCSLVPANWPSSACVIAVGGWIVNEYMNMFEVVAMAEGGRRKPARPYRAGWIDVADRCGIWMVKREEEVKMER